MLTPAEAEAQVFAHTANFPTEECPLSEAHNRILRADIRADRDLPPFDRVTLDGYALRSSALAAGTRRFHIEAVQAAGMRPFTLGPDADACIEIMTGAMLPAGADCVVPYEAALSRPTPADGEKNADAGAEGVTYYVTLSSDAVRNVGPGHAVHARGSDHPAGQVVVPAGRSLSGREIAVAATCGCATLLVSRRPKIAVVCTGDELVEVDAAVAPHLVRRSNDYALRAALITAGYPQVERFHLHDMRHEIEHQGWHILAEFDVVLLAGGVSKGKFDYLPEVLESLGVRKVFHGVAQRPGKPFWFGVGPRPTAVFALPGNPVSAYTCLCRYVLPALDRASGLTPAVRPTARLTAAVEFEPPLAYLLPVRQVASTDGVLAVQPAPYNTSGDLAGLVDTNGFIELPADRRSFPAGYVAPFYSW